MPRKQQTLFDLIETKENEVEKLTLKFFNGVGRSGEKFNYRYNTLDDIGAGGQKTKYKANVEAAKLLKDIEKETRLATSQEQSILTRYTGLSQWSMKKQKGGKRSTRN